MVCRSTEVNFDSWRLLDLAEHARHAHSRFENGKAIEGAVCSTRVSSKLTSQTSAKEIQITT